MEMTDDIQIGEKIIIARVMDLKASPPWAIMELEQLMDQPQRAHQYFGEFEIKTRTKTFYAKDNSCQVYSSYFKLL